MSTKQKVEKTGKIARPNTKQKGLRSGEKYTFLADEKRKRGKFVLVELNRPIDTSTVTISVSNINPSNRSSDPTRKLLKNIAMHFGLDHRPGIESTLLWESEDSLLTVALEITSVIKEARA